MSIDARKIASIWVCLPESLKEWEMTCGWFSVSHALMTKFWPAQVRYSRYCYRYHKLLANTDNNSEISNISLNSSCYCCMPILLLYDRVIPKFIALFQRMIHRGKQLFVGVFHQNIITSVDLLTSFPESLICSSANLFNNCLLNIYWKNARNLKADH